MQLAADERRDLADLLDTLTPEQWDHPSLCAGWAVRDVVAHVISCEEIGYVGLAAAFIRGGFGPSRVNRVRLAAYRNHEPEQLVRILRSHLKPSGLTAGFGGGIGLSDSLIHRQDIRRPLGLPRDVPADRVLEALQISLRPPSCHPATTPRACDSSPSTSTGTTATATKSAAAARRSSWPWPGAPQPSATSKVRASPCSNRASHLAAPLGSRPVRRNLIASASEGAVPPGFFVIAAR